MRYYIFGSNRLSDLHLLHSHSQYSDECLLIFFPLFTIHRYCATFFPTRKRKMFAHLRHRHSFRFPFHSLSHLLPIPLKFHSSFPFSLSLSLSFSFSISAHPGGLDEGRAEIYFPSYMLRFLFGAFLCLFSFSYSFSVGLICWVFPAELFPFRSVRLYYQCGYILVCLCSVSVHSATAVIVSQASVTSAVM
jgi:hypothetical protein